MLDPQNRLLLLDSLRPPLGYELDYAVGTTYSLDLLALLTVPLSFTMFETEDRDGRVVTESTSVLEALRRHSGNLDIFCQAGQMKVPAPQLTLFHLEDRVHEIARRAGSFHAKVWVLRYKSVDQPAILRTLCLSRNLTFDRCWDVMAVLEGQLSERRKASRASAPLSAFVRALPGMAVDIDPAVAHRLDSLADDVDATKFEAPAGFDAVHFWPLGIDGRNPQLFQGTYDRSVVVSPFIAAGELPNLPKGKKQTVLISRIEELDTVSPTSLRKFASDIYTLSADANVEPLEGFEPLATSRPELAGLHAKVYIAELGKEAHVWLGSANATVAAFNQNVEFLVQLSAPTKVAGVDVFMGADSDDASLMSMLTPYSLPTAAADPDADERALKHALDVATRAVYGAGLRLSVSPARDRTFTTTVTAQRLLDWPSDVIARCWSVNRDESSAVPMKIGPAQPVCLGDTEIQGLSRFLAIELTATLGRRTCTRTFSMCLPMDGAPADRAQSVLRSLLNSRERVLQYLMFLLADETTAIDLLPPGGEGGSGTETACAVREVTLFETLLKALARSPEKIDQVATLVSDLGRDAEGNSFLPEGFDLIWPAFAQARAEQHHEGKTETI